MTVIYKVTSYEVEVHHRKFCTAKTCMSFTYLNLYSDQFLIAMKITIHKVYTFIKRQGGDRNGTLMISIHRFECTVCNKQLL